MEWLYQPVWSPYICGAGIGILAGLTLLISRKALSCSTSFAKSAGMIEKLMRGERAVQREFFRKHGFGIDWQWMLVFGIFLGSLLSSVLSGSFAIQFVSCWWTQNVGSSVFLRLVAVFTGGILMGFGARLADGCTSGHGISGMIQLSISSLVAVICFFVGGIGTALMIVTLFGGGH